MITITSRNIRIFFRDKTSVFFSLLAVFIIIGLYVFFLGDVTVKGMEGEGLKNPRFLMDSWIMAGLLAVTSITTTMGAFGIMVEDRSKKIIKDFSASPISRSALAGGYILSAFCIGLIMSLLAFIFAEIYIVASGGSLLEAKAMVKIFLTMILSVFSSSAIVFFIVSFFKSQNAFATASTVIGTLIGFLTGVYIPIGQLPEGVQMVIKVFPVSHAGALFRQIMMAQPLKETFNQAPTEVISQFKADFGVHFVFGNYTTTPLFSTLVLLITGGIFYGLAILKLSQKTK